MSYIEFLVYLILLFYIRIHLFYLIRRIWKDVLLNYTASLDVAVQSWSLYLTASWFGVGMYNCRYPDTSTYKTLLRLEVM